MSETPILKREPIFKGRLIDVALETVDLPNGNRVAMEIIRHPGGAAAVALDAQRRVCLLRQYRHAADGWLWELPAGKIDPGEAHLATATRELAEEAGVTARDWTGLGFIHSSPGVFTEIVYLWLARDLDLNDHAQECDEVMEIHWLPLCQALDWCNDGTITDAKTLAGLYRAAALTQ